LSAVRTSLPAGADVDIDVYDDVDDDVYDDADDDDAAADVDDDKVAPDGTHDALGSDDDGVASKRL